MSVEQASLFDFEGQTADSDLSFEDVMASIDADNLTMDMTESFAEDLFEQGRDAYRGGSNCCTVRLPNERLALLWRGAFRVQFTDGGFGTQERNQLEHPFAYANAEIEVDETLSTPVFEGRGTHEKLASFQEHFDPVSFLKEDMVSIVRLGLQTTDYDMDDVDEDLALLDRMEYSKLFDIDKCKKCSTQQLYEPC